MEFSKEIYQNREACLKRWVKDYSGAILHTCLYLMPDQERAEEVMQDTLIKAWRYLGSGKNKRMPNERAWLLRIANNTCKDYLREGRQRADQKLLMEELPPKMLKMDLKDRSITLLALDLPEKLRQIVLLFYFQGMTQHEIAALLNISIPTVNRRLRSAGEAMRKSFNREPDA